MTTWNKLTAVKIKKLKERGSYHDGDIGAAVVPIPTTAWLFGSALAGLLVARSKNDKMNY